MNRNVLRAGAGALALGGVGVLVATHQPAPERITTIHPNWECATTTYAGQPCIGPGPTTTTIKVTTSAATTTIVLPDCAGPTPSSPPMGRLPNGQCPTPPSQPITVPTPASTDCAHAIPVRTDCAAPATTPTTSTTAAPPVADTQPTPDTTTIPVATSIPQGGTPKSVPSTLPATR